VHFAHQLTWKGKSIAIVHVGIDLAKTVFAVHGIDEHGRALPRSCERGARQTDRGEA
jgi:hypothetical protein